MVTSSAGKDRTRYELHVERWRGCQACDLCHRRKNVVLARGKVSCDLLFVGEAPGVSEDVLGRPFVGPAGQLLDQIIEEGLGCFCICPHEDCVESPFWSSHGPNEMTCCPECGRQQAPHPLRMAWTNLIACIPLEDDGTKTDDPPDESVEACRPRLQEFVALADPRLIVCVGKCPEGWMDPGYKHSIKFHRDIPRVGITHPAAILRAPVAQQGLMRKRCVVTLRNAVEEYL